METFLIIDGNSLACRAAFAHNPKWGDDLQTSDGKLTGATYRFFTMLDKIFHKLKPTHVVVCWDTGRETFRTELDENYKANREKKNEDLYVQFGDIKRILEAIGIKNVGIIGYEADDVVGTYSELSKADQTYVFSGDKDSFQLATDNVTIVYPKGGINNIDYITPEYIEKKYNIDYKQYIDMKALVGDAGDNIPGIKGCAEKTASKLLKYYGNAKEVAKNKDNIECKGINKRVKAGIKEWAISVDDILTLVTIVKDIIVPFDYSDCKINLDWEEARDIFNRLEFKSFLEKLDDGGFYNA
ncbi:MAG: 5'-3' exonuclease [archaeon]